jgi:hypothetical protein
MYLKVFVPLIAFAVVLAGCASPRAQGHVKVLSADWPVPADGAVGQRMELSSTERPTLLFRLSIDDDARMALVAVDPDSGAATVIAAWPGSADLTGMPVVRNATAAGYGVDLTVAYTAPNGTRIIVLAGSGVRTLNWTSAANTTAEPVDGLANGTVHHLDERAITSPPQTFATQRGPAVIHHKGTLVSAGLSGMMLGFGPGSPSTSVALSGPREWRSGGASANATNEVYLLTMPPAQWGITIDQQRTQGRFFGLAWTIPTLQQASFVAADHLT